MASRMRAPVGISTDGVRQVTGRLDPAMNAKPMLRDVSYISFAHSQFQDRCLSLNTGTERPLDAEHLHDLLEELVARIVRLPLLVARVLAVLADQHHAVDGQLAAAAASALRRWSG